MGNPFGCNTVLLAGYGIDKPGTGKRGILVIYIAGYSGPPCIYMSIL